jgi:hypothetical protein
MRILESSLSAGSAKLFDALTLITEVVEPGQLQNGFEPKIIYLAQLWRNIVAISRILNVQSTAKGPCISTASSDDEQRSRDRY